MLIRDIHAPASWSNLADRAIAGHAPVLVLGAVDAGKSTLVHYLLGRLVAAAGSAALLDGDVGMATAGPSGLVGLTLVRDVDTLDERAFPDRSWFVGSTSPTGSLLPIVLGHVHLMSIATGERLPVVVNTSGLVSGGLGKTLALALADAVSPKLVAGLGDEGDLEHLLAPLEARGLAVVRLPRSPRARVKPKSERTGRRTERFARYFQDSPIHSLALASVALEGTLLGSGRPLAAAEREEIERGLDTHVLEAEEAGDAVAIVVASAPLEEGRAHVERALGGRRIHVLTAAETTGTLVGLLGADGDCVAMGLFEGFRGDGTVEVQSPINPAALKTVRRLELGSIRLLRDGEEIGPRERERALGDSA